MTVRYETTGHRAIVTLDDPARRNPLSAAMLAGLHDAYATAKADAAVRVVITTGAGSAFCAGGDLSSGFVTPTSVSGPRTGEDADAGPSQLDAHRARGQFADLLRALYGLGKPTIARVNGHALAGGFGLALAHDLIVAGRAATFGTPEINVGLWPMMITAPMLRSMAPRKVLELQLTGRRLDAAEAERFGFLTRLVDDADLDASVDELASTMERKSPAIMRLGKEYFYATLDLGLEDALRHLQTGLTLVTLSEDAKEGIAAFQEKREPRFTGR